MTQANSSYATWESKPLRQQLNELQAEAGDYLNFVHNSSLSHEEREAAYFKFLVSLATGLTSLHLEELDPKDVKSVG